MSLEELAQAGHLRAHKTSNNEITKLLKAIDRDLSDSQLQDLSADRRFATAYNAALLASTTALAASGYRTQQEGHHYWSIQSLVFTLHLDPDTVEQLNVFRKKRNIVDYVLATDLKTQVIDWLNKNHADLI